MAWKNVSVSSIAVVRVYPIGQDPILTRFCEVVHTLNKRGGTMGDLEV